MCANEEGKSATNFSSAAANTANDVFAIVYFITVATFCFASLIIAIFCARFLICEKREYVGGKEDDENYVVTPVSGPALTKTAIHTRWLRELLLFVCTSTLTWQNGGKEESTEGEHTELKQTRAGKRSNYMCSVYTGCSRVFVLSSA